MNLNHNKYNTHTMHAKTNAVAHPYSLLITTSMYVCDNHCTKLSIIISNRRRGAEFNVPFDIQLVI